MSVYKRGEVYWVEFQAQKKRVRESTGTSNKRKALDYERRLRAQIADELHSSRLGEKVNRTYEEAVTHWIDIGAPKSMMSHAAITVDFLHDTPLSLVPENTSVMKSSMRKKGLSVQTINRRLAVVKRVLNLAYTDRDWETNLKVCHVKNLL